MTHERLGDIAEALNWGRTRFTDPEGAIKREEFVRLEFQKYLETDVAKARDPETNKILGSMQWLGKYLPTVDLYQVVALAMEGKYKAEELQEAAELARRDHAAEEALHVELAKTEPACEKRRQAVAPDKPASKPALRRKK
jgi:hypothetical protein